MVACCYYLCTDTANFATLVLNFTQNAVEQNCRDAKSLANLALIFFSSREVADLLDKSNPAECAEGVTMRPRATIVPAIPFDANMPDAVEIKKRIYYGRLMDFFIADFFDALACGRYLWQLWAVLSDDNRTSPTLLPDTAARREVSMLQACQESQDGNGRDESEQASGGR